MANAVETTELKPNLSAKGDGKGEPECAAKKRHMALVYRRRAQRMIEVRKAAPTRAALQKALKVGLPPEEQAAAERALFDSQAHLRPERDAPLVKSLATLNALLPHAWLWFTELGWLAKATASGRVRWNPGLQELVKLEERRLKLADALLVTPRARHQAGLPVDPADEAIDVVAEARALAREQDEESRRYREAAKDREDDGEQDAAAD
jgi:hypothetical protein